MTITIWKNQKGFTLTELIVAAGLSLVVLAAGYSVFRVQTHTVKAQEFKMEAQEYARVALDMMVREIRNLGFFPTFTPCLNPPIITATTTTFQFVYDANADGLCTGTVATAGADENVTYALTGGNITRAVNGGAAQPLTAGNVTNTTMFTYFDNAGIATTTLANIKRVNITISVLSRSTDVQFGGLQTITMNSSVDLRNRCFNLPTSC
jgi:prepilin-type N-terminal cleavage/methylation domain-containing protein